MQTFYQLDENGIFMFAVHYTVKPYLSVAVIPPSIPSAQAARWVTKLHPVQDIDFGEQNTGQWELQEDNRSNQYYVVPSGAQYTFNTEHEGQKYDGVGVPPAWLTSDAQPSPEHEWKDGAWWINPTLEQERQDAVTKAEVDARIQSETQRANNIIAPLQDAVELEIATEQEQAEYTAWRRYRVFLSRVATQPGYPLNVEWPTAPDA